LGLLEWFLLLSFQQYGEALSCPNNFSTRQISKRQPDANYFGSMLIVAMVWITFRAREKVHCCGSETVAGVA
jgi:hypothetical protein